MRHPIFRCFAAPFTAFMALAASMSGSLLHDRGASGTWQKLLKLRTIGSVLHTTAHPDDEQGGVLTRLSRGEGARVALLTLTRGESGDNAIGSELFDALGLIRTEELRCADEYYGVDEQYFTTAIDYGFSKRLEEALAKWGRDDELREVVRVIRIERPLVVISRFQGNGRDGHGNHQAAGLITWDAFRVAGDPAMFPEQLREGLRPWQALKLYMGGVRENEDWTIRVDSGVFSPWIGDTYANFAGTGLSFQRSQNGGRNDRVNGPAYAYYKRLDSRVTAPVKESNFFDGIDPRVQAVFTTLGRPVPAGTATLDEIARSVDDAITAFALTNPSASVEPLARGLSATRTAMRQFADDADVVHVLAIKEQQFADAIIAALGLDFSAVASSSGRADMATFAPPQTMGPAVPGQTFDVTLRLTNAGTPPIHLIALRVSGVASPLEEDAALRGGETIARSLAVTVPADAPPTRPAFSRESLAQSRYVISNPALRFRPASPPPFVATADFSVFAVPVEIAAAVTRREAQRPYGYAMRELSVVPALAVRITPRQAIVPITGSTGSDRLVRVEVELLNNSPSGAQGVLTLRLPTGWTAAPAQVAFALTRAGEKMRQSFEIRTSSIAARDYVIAAVASVKGREFSDGYDVLEHRDLETRYLYRPARTSVRGVDVQVAPGLRVGYVMGAGDEVPAAIAQLGASVALLDEQDLAAGDLSRFDAILTGTRAYGVREDLRTYNERLLEYAHDGGNLVVLYNTPAEFDPARFAPFPAQLPAAAEEVSEEDAPVQILEPARAEFTKPNVITPADFDGWVEQRGSKFFSAWDHAYTPMIESHDSGQPPQQGGWVTATYGKGRYTYFAYALHRQLPYGVPGAYRLLANLLSLTRR